MAWIAEDGGPSEADIELCSKPAIPRDVDIHELCRLLTVLKSYPNKRWPAKPEVVLVDKVVMAVRGCSSVIKARQDAALAAGAVPLLVDVITGVHASDKETCLRAAQCIMGVAGKNDGVIAAFKEAGAEAALHAIVATHDHKDMKTALALICPE